MLKMKPYSVILYYNYTPIPNAEAYREKHHLFCIENNLLGRIIIAKEGLNGTVSGLIEDCQKYMTWLEKDPLFTAKEWSPDQRLQPVLLDLSERHFLKSTLRVFLEDQNQLLPQSCESCPQDPTYDHRPDEIFA